MGCDYYRRPSVILPLGFKSGSLREHGVNLAIDFVYDRNYTVAKNYTGCCKELIDAMSEGLWLRFQLKKKHTNDLSRQLGELKM